MFFYIYLLIYLYIYIYIYIYIYMYAYIVRWRRELMLHKSTKKNFGLHPKSYNWNPHHSTNVMAQPAERKRDSWKTKRSIEPFGRQTKTGPSCCGIITLRNHLKLPILAKEDSVLYTNVKQR